MSSLPSIAVLGSINLDLVLRCPKLPQPGETVSADQVQEFSGGKGANQAVGAARLGAHVRMIGRVGEDAPAERLLRNLQAENIETTWVQRTENCGSDMGIVSVDPSGENAIVVVPGANQYVSRADVEQAAAVIRVADVLLVQLEISIDTVQFAVRLSL